VRGILAGVLAVLTIGRDVQGKTSKAAKGEKEKGMFEDQMTLHLNRALFRKYTYKIIIIYFFYISFPVCVSLSLRNCNGADLDGLLLLPSLLFLLLYREIFILSGIKESQRARG